jgi:uncharacterized membrane protein
VNYSIKSNSKIIIKKLMNYFYIKKHVDFIVLFLILILAAGLRIYHLGFKSISIDEAIGALYAIEPLHRVIVLTINDVHPPFFYVLQHFWIKAFGWSEPALRSISVFFAFLAIIALYQLGKKLFNRRVGLLSAFLLTLSPWHIWISQNARSNSMLLFLVILSTYSFYQILTTGQKKWFLIYCLTTIISLYTHYFSFMIWIAQTLYVIYDSFIRNKLLRTWIILQILILSAYVFWLPFMISQFFTKSRPLYKTLTPEFVKNLFDFLNPYSAIPQLSIFRLAEIILFIIFVFGLITLFQQRYTAVQSLAGFNLADNQKLKRMIYIFLILTIGGFICCGYFIHSSWTLALVQKNIALNSPIYSDTVKPYHAAQLQSFSMSFYLSALIAIAALIFLYSLNQIDHVLEFTAEKISNIFSHKVFKRQQGISKFDFLMVHSLLPLLIAGLISLKSPYLLIRNMIIFVPVWFIVLSLALTTMKRAAFSISFIAILLFAGFSFINFETWMKKDDWRSAADVARQHVHKDDVILLDHLFGKKPFYYYGLQTIKPLTKDDARPFLAAVKGDVWLLYTYSRKREWYAYDLLNAEWNKIAEWQFEGTTNIDDMKPIDGVIRLIQYRKK